MTESLSQGRGDPSSGVRARNTISTGSVGMMLILIPETRVFFNCASEIPNPSARLQALRIKTTHCANTNKMMTKTTR